MKKYGHFSGAELLCFSNETRLVNILIILMLQSNMTDIDLALSFKLYKNTDRSLLQASAQYDYEQSLTRDT